MAAILRMVTQEPHQAGTDENRRVGQKLAELWKKNGLESNYRLFNIKYSNFK